MCSNLCSEVCSKIRIKGGADCGHYHKIVLLQLVALRNNAG